MKKTIIHFIFLLILFSSDIYSQTKEFKTGELDKSSKIDTLNEYRPDGTKHFEVLIKNGLKNGTGLLFDRNNNIIGLRHYENDTLHGFGLLLNKKTFRPKYLYEVNNGVFDGVIIDFYDNGSIKSFRNKDTFNDSQTLEFHENGVIKKIGQTKKGQSHGTIFYFDKSGKLEKKVEYEEGEPKK
ncbi:toxin-antitoxin system YwqK family antitoxin [Psychroflexus aestuariivivens]|uniref:toxin-antitoxin system YwqK family antitoxin n=1 Tax=Psychroflexus aestuariivivens TaxID=1795040 RepID=UPI000FDA0CB8|nr:hypothetical protein [Psychroflexus aestuariivivens]